MYWSIAGVAGVIFLGLVAFRRQRAWRFVGLQVALTLMWVSLGSAAYAVLNGM
ncbi:hypothetical protein NPS01_28600 [Nocardioides psychrotolerans]|uniref:Uncharacterized protein n=1 Tax=Nocardioides psychrotolerans TaxID=1005945 RepID=A0A1I3ERF7_9ACTN|nr:hypothetical protein [Nocardioides psychrotolerans]GEP39197.1 hypothetical protein NPS01_28600 [Nocardioides psychrotolerans]SFI01231.1 hypothetical protein SAMN05216561_10412 [Nocardioides psychrotolerans]